ncbi:hypothetical protein [Rhizobium sp. Root1220]|uniref:hypothetical protein n=1 Tax=Rhizobium sp. Root1220 TaxID=1736432 RepID=UPI000AAA3A1C|nr:hypothetical protein [Rhizobium sp. Root1220]
MTRKPERSSTAQRQQRFEETDRTAAKMINAETLARRKKTERLQAAREERRASQSKTG